MHISRLALVGYRTTEKCILVVNDGLGALSEPDYLIPKAFVVIISCDLSIIIVVFSLQLL